MNVNFMNVNFKKTIIFSLAILLNLSFFSVTSINAALIEDNLGSTREFQKQAAPNNSLKEQKNSLSVEEAEILKAKKLEWQPLAPKTQNKSLNSEKGLQNNSKQEKLDYVPGEILVKYKKNRINLETSSGRAAASNFVRNKSIEKKEDLRKNNISVLKIKDAKTVEQKIAELKNDPNVEYAQPNFQYYPLSIDTNDTYKANLWGLDNTGQTVNTVAGTDDADIDAPEAWAINEGTNDSIIVAVIDSGVAYNHPDLANNMWDGTNCVSDTNTVLGGCNHGYDYKDSDKTPLPTTSSHGTHIAGTIAAVKNNSKGIIGVAPNAKIMALKSSLTTAENVKAINFAKYNGAKVINASWGDAFNSGAYSHIYLDSALYNAIKDFPGLFIAAAGNGAQNHDSGNLNTMMYPAGFRVSSTAGPGLDNIIVVAATDHNDVLATFSDYGAISVDVGAPGGEHPNPNDGMIYSTVADSISFSENFEVGTYNVAGGGVTQSYWFVGNDGYSKVAYSDSNYPYKSNAYTWLMQKNTLDLSASNISGASMSFTIWCDTPDTFIFDDYIQTSYFSNGTWHNSTKYNEDSIWSDGGSSRIDNGHLGYYKTYTENISNYLTNDFKFSFDWHTNSSVDSNWGCSIDNVEITKFSDGSDEIYGYMEGTSMAAPHVAGLAALIEGYNPNLTTSQVKDTILTTGDSLTSLSGKTVSGKRINAQKALEAVNPAKAITDFSFASPAATGVINETTHTIAITVPYGTNVTALVPTIATSTGAIVSPASGVVQNFTNPVTYTVTAQDSSTQTYVVTVTVALNPTKAITAFSFSEGAGVINETNHTIAVAVPFGTNVTALVPTIATSTGATVSPSSGLAQNFTSPVIYTVTAADSSTQTYTVTVTVAANTAKAITAFSFASPAATGVINETTHTIAITVPYGTNVTALVPTIATSTGAIVSPASGVVQNFTNPVTYTVTAQDSSTQTYTVTVTMAADPVATAFSAIASALTSAGIVNNLDTVTSSNYTNFSGLYFEKRTNVADATTAIGRITFNSALDLSNSETKIFLQNLGTKMDANTAGAIGLDFTGATDSLTLKGTGATIKFYGLDALGFNVGSTADEINSKLVALDDSGSPLDKSTLVPSAGTYLGACEVGGGCYVFTVGVNHFTKYKIDNTAPANQDTVFSSNISKKGGDPVTIVSSGETGGAIWFAPSGTASFVAGVTMTTAGGIATSILAPATEGNYKLYVVDSVGNISAASIAVLTVDNSAPTNQDTVFSSSISKKGGGSVTIASSGETGGAIWFAPSDTSLFIAGSTMTTAGGTATSINAPANAGDYKLFVIDAPGNVSAASTAILTVDNIAPTVTKLGDNSADVVLSIGATDLVFSETLYSSSKTAVQNALTTGADKTLTYTWSGAILTITATEATIFANDVVANVTDMAGNSSVLLLIDSSLTATQITPNESGSVTVKNTTSEVVITNPTQATTITINSGTTDPKIDVSSFISGGTGTLPAITITSINANNTNIVIPASTVVTSADATWNGVIAAPTATTVTLPETSGQTKTLSTAIEVGFIDAKLSFDKAVRILLPNQAGKKAGYVRTGITFTEITNTCAADNQTTGDALLSESECKIDVGSDLVIWTKHFTSFVTYTQSAIIAPPPTPTPVSNSGGGGGGGGGAPAPTPTDASMPTGVLIDINSGATTTANKTVALILSASDSSSIQMMISNDPDFNGASWENYSTAKSWVLTGENGTKTVYAKFKDAYNNISSVVYKSISLNSTEVISEQNTEPKVMSDKITSPIAPKAVLGEKIVNQSITIKKDFKKEKEVIAKYTTPFTKGIKSLKAKDISKITNFIAYGTLDAKTVTPAVNALSVVDRSSVLNDYKLAFGRVPVKTSEWGDVVKIASGSLPKARNARREALGKSEFRKIFKRSIKANNAVDNLTVGIIAYGVKVPVTASALNKAKKTFVSIYKRQPKTASNMNIVRAIAYRGVK